MSDDEEPKEQIAIGVCKLLPPDARKLLLQAAASRSVRAIDAATDYARACYPLQFQRQIGLRDAGYKK